MNMKPKLFFTVILVLAIGIGSKIAACSPVRVPFDVYANAFTPQGAYYAVEGYYTDKANFMVTYTSDSIVSVGKILPVFEYGPFGSQCENYVMPANVDENQIGKDKLRILILYKDQTTADKLVTPIFQTEGVDATGDAIRLVDSKLDPEDGNTKKVMRSVLKKNLYQRLFEGKNISLNWNEEIFKPFDE